MKETEGLKKMKKTILMGLVIAACVTLVLSVGGFTAYAIARNVKQQKNMLNALEAIGLIEREKDKKYNPDKIYVKMFVDQASERKPRNNAMSEMQTPERQNNIIRITGPASEKSDMTEKDMFGNQTLEIIDDRTVNENGAYDDDAMFEKQTSEADTMFENQTYEASPCTDFKH